LPKKIVQDDEYEYRTETAATQFLGSIAGDQRPEEFVHVDND
jgi:hypothetical protein